MAKFILLFRIWKPQIALGIVHLISTLLAFSDNPTKDISIVNLVVFIVIYKKIYVNNCILKMIRNKHEEKERINYYTDVGDEQILYLVSVHSA